MANEKKVKIQFDTKADTKGAKDTKKAVDEVTEATNEATAASQDLQKANKEQQDALAKQRRDDVEEVKRRREAKDAADAQAESMKKIEVVGRAIVAGQLAENLRGMVGQLSAAAAEGGEFSEELAGLRDELAAVSSGLDSFTAGMQAFIASGNAGVAVAASLIVGVKGVASAYSEMKQAQRDLDEAPKRLAEALKFTADAQAALGRQVAFDRLREDYKLEADELERQQRALQRIAELRGAQNNAAVATAEANLQITRNNGGDVALAEAQLLQTRFQSQLSDLEGNLSLAVKRAEDARIASEAAVNTAVEARKTMDVNKDEYKDLISQADAALSAATEAAKDRDLEIEKFASAKTAIIARAEAELSTLEMGTVQQVSADAQKVRDSIYKALGEEFSQVSAAIPQVTGQVSEGVRQQIALTTQNIATERQTTVQMLSGVTINDSQVESLRSGFRSVLDGQGKVITAVGAFNGQMEVTLSSFASSISSQAYRLGELESQIRSIRR